MKRFFILIYNRKADPRYRQFHDAFTAHPNFKTWWHFIQSAYIIHTDLSANSISAYARAEFEKLGLPTTHLVLAVDLTERQGMLTKEAWAWIRKQAASIEEDSDEY